MNPSRDQVENICRKALRAPSGDNSQPWDLRWNDDLLEVVFLPARAKHILDCSKSASQLAVGALLESISIAAAGLGFGIEPTWLGLNERANVPCLSIKFLNTKPAVDDLIQGLEVRETDRRVFKEAKLPMAALEKISSEFSRRESDIHAHFLEKIPSNFRNYLLWSESLVAQQPQFLFDTLPWVRFTRGQARRAKDGMPWRGLGTRIFEVPSLWLLSKYPSLFSVFNSGGMLYKQYQAAVAKQIDSSGLVCISADPRNPQALLKAGRLGMRLWLRLNLLGYGVHPLTLSSVMVYNAAAGKLDPFIKQNFGHNFTEAKNLFTTTFPIPHGEVPVWLFRSGVSTRLPENWRTFRRSI